MNNIPTPPMPHIPTPGAPAPIVTEAQLPAKYKPMGAWSYFGHSLLFSIPFVGFILLIVFAVGGTGNINKRNFARSYFCGYIILAIVVAVLLIFSAAGLVSLAELSELM